MHNSNQVEVFDFIQTKFRNWIVIHCPQFNLNQVFDLTQTNFTNWNVIHFIELQITKIFKVDVKISIHNSDLNKCEFKSYFWNQRWMISELIQQRITYFTALVTGHKTLRKVDFRKNTNVSSDSTYFFFHNVPL